MNRISVAASAVMLSMMFACTVQEPPIVKGPMTARPQSQPQMLANGGIFQVTNFRPLFEDRVPTLVGDTLTVMIQEKSSTSASEKVNESRKSGLSETVAPGVNLPFIPNRLANSLSNVSLNANSNATHTGSGTNQVSTTFVSSISVTVIDILANGNLVISGEKQVRINGDTESIRLSGVVNPRDISADRTVSSLKVADARIEQQTKGNNRLYNDPGWLTKIFMTILPF